MPDDASRTQEVDQGSEPEQVVEFSIPDGTDLNEIYDEEGEPRFQHEEHGWACDANGNRIPERRPDPNPEEDEPPAEEPEPEKKPFSFRSPYVDGVAEDPDLALLETDPAAYINKKVQEGVARGLQAQAQQSLAARDIGIDPEVTEYFADKIPLVQAYVPVEWKGTRNAVMAELALSALLEAVETGDFTGAMRKLSGSQPSQEAPPRQRQTTVIPTSARMPSPRSAPEAVRETERVRGPRDVASDSLGVPDALAILQRERRR